MVIACAAHQLSAGASNSRPSRHSIRNPLLTSECTLSTLAVEKRRVCPVTGARVRLQVPGCGCSVPELSDPLKRLGVLALELLDAPIAGGARPSTRDVEPPTSARSMAPVAQLFAPRDLPARGAIHVRIATGFPGRPDRTRRIYRCDRRTCGRERGGGPPLRIADRRWARPRAPDEEEGAWLHMQRAAVRGAPCFSRWRWGRR